MPGTGFFSLDDESYDAFLEWVRARPSSLQFQITRWLELAVNEPDRPPAELLWFHVIEERRERIEIWRVKFQDRFDFADIVFAVNLGRATLSFIVYDEHLDR